MYRNKRMSATKRAYLAGLRKGKRIGARRAKKKKVSYRRFKYGRGYKKW